MVALGEQLTAVHQALRERLVVLREEALDGARGLDDVLLEDLRSHCLGLCSAVRTHHNGEDNQLWPGLRAAAPELGPVINKLIEDHALVAGILQRINELLTSDLPGPGALTRELDGLMAILESHFGYEERRIAQALDTLGPSAWTADVFAPGQATDR